MSFTKEQIQEYNHYKKQHIEHWEECPQCRGPSIRSNLYEGWRECIACKNDKGEGRPIQPRKPKTIEDYFNNK